MTHPADFFARPFAHRALHGAAGPENSMGAIKAAVAGGWGIEVDVQLSSDGQAMVFHDYDLRRLTHDTGAVQLRSAADLGAIALKGTDDGIPTLPQALAQIAGQVPLVIEIKDQDGAMGPNIGPLEQAVADALADYTGPVAMMSFNPHSVTHFGQIAPHIPRGLVTSAYTPEAWAPLPRAVCDRLRDIPDFDSSGAQFISHEAADLAAPRVAELRAQGTPILTWTIRSPQAEATARQYCDQVTFEGYLPA